MPIQAVGEPAGDEQGGGAAGGRRGDGELFDFRQAGQGGGVVEHPGEGVAPGEEAGPIEVAEDDAVALARGDVADEGELVGGVFPGGAVVDDAVDPAPEFFIERLGEVGFPPEAEREVGIEVGKNDVRQGGGAVAVEAEGDLLGANLAPLAGHVAVGVDPGFRAGFLRAGVRDDEDGAAGVLAGDGGDERGVGGGGAGVLGVDDEVDEGGAGLGVVAGLPEFAEFLFDPADLDGQPWLEGCFHFYSRLQVAPWRLMRSSACEGPQVPEE